MGKPGRVNLDHPDLASGSRPRELKHLSTWRNRNQYPDFVLCWHASVDTVHDPGISLVAASETEGAQTVPQGAGL